MLGFLKRIFARAPQPEPDSADVEELRATFKARYHHFKLLLNANNKALDLMTEMEQALNGNRPFGMAFVRANCTGISTSVFQIVKNLNELAPGKYEELFPRFRAIQESIGTVLARKEVPEGGQYVMRLDQVDKEMADQVGSKMANLGEVAGKVGLPVSQGFVITAQAYHRFMQHNRLQQEIDRKIQAAVTERLDQLFALTADLQQLLIRAPLPEDLEQAIMDAYRELEREVGAGVRVSVRSSALGEDMAGTSFAGQYRSELNVSGDNLIDAYKGVLASKYGLPAMTYRLNRGIRDEDVAMSVGCMAMVQASAGGVMYTCNPMNIRDTSISINSVWGLAKSVVDGSVTPDLFVVARSDPMMVEHRDIQVKERKFVCYPDEGVCRLDLTGESGAEPSLSDQQAVELAAMAVQLEAYYGSPQDIEWAIDAAGRIFILQCRPLQQTPGSGAGSERTTAEDEHLVIAYGGRTASPGVACGPVFVLRRDMEALQFPEGGVLVTSQSLPRWASLLSKASAVVTEQGSVAGHLANVAREFRVPALFGVSRATELLQTGELVTVDAEGLRVYRGHIGRLLELEPRTRPNLMAGSPIYELLEQVVQYVVPLNLIDPESTEFRPDKCTTFHDITRFCHEKSVFEMFNFGKEHHFSEKSSKQLVCDVPMQFWIINLDDGFRGEVGKRYVELSNIVSIPMLAIWDGMVAVPWAGPPPVDAKGFMSVLLQASANPSLDPAVHSHYTARNYFMISRNFCSLSSRFGFHFSTVETLVGDRPVENYISFQFKGGAADLPRRVRRAMFVAGLLDHYGFRVEVREDSAFARVEGLDREAMCHMLRIIGYLIIHTRQLDMIMSSDAAVGRHWAKILSDIGKAVAPSFSPGPMVGAGAVPEGL